MMPRMTRWPALALSISRSHPLSGTMPSATAASRRRWRLLALVALALGGCAYQPPHAWEKRVLAKPEMQIQPMIFPNDALGLAMTQHVYNSKENTSGSGSVGGGGCGCN